MTVIYKYPFPIGDRFTLALPKGFQILSVQVQNGTPCIWALVKTESPEEIVRFRVFGTGHDITNVKTCIHVGTIQMGSYVWHVFQER